MHILTTPQTYPYSVSQLMRDNPQTSFPRNPSDALLAEYNVYPVKPTELPEFDPMTQRIEEGTPVLQDGEWVQVWDVIDLTAEEIAQLQAERAEQVRQQRQSAYQAEADPLFFKWQAGEGTQEDWLAKRQEIRDRYQ